MRLVHLAMQGFGAFRDRVELDFDDVDYFALIGPTGAGKSTVIDAVCFVLYGTVPRYDDRRLVRHAVTIGASEAKVSLAFDLEGERYVATRVVRRTPRGTVTTKEARLERGADVLAGTERELSEQVVRLLGLSFDDFTRCVAIPQGDFAQFLRAKGEERRGLMIRLLNLGVYERIGERARRLAAEHKAAAQAQEARLEQLAFATDAARETAARHLDAATALRTALDEAVAGLAQLDADLRAAADAGDAAARALTALATVRIPADAGAFGSRLAELTERVTTARHAVEASEEARRQAEAALDGLPPVAELQRTLAAHDDLARLDDARGELVSRLDTARADLTAAATARDQQQEALDRAEADLDAARREHLALELADGLHAGDDCPVCLRRLDAVPDHPPAPALDQARRAVESARQHLEKARRAHDEQAKAVHGLEVRLGDADAARADVAGRLAGQPARDELAALIERVEAAEAALRRARLTEDDTREDLRHAEQARSELDATGGRLQRQFDQQRDAVTALGPPPRGGELLGDWEALAGWAQAHVQHHEQARTDAAARVQELEALRRTTFERLRTEAGQAGVSLPDRDEPTALSAATAAAEERARAEVARLDDARTERTAIEAAVVELRRDNQVADQLGQLLRSNAFPDWLVAEALELLALDASAIVRELTGGRYSLATTETEFVVIDHANADEQRPARSLSGGETFQASLALALALAAQVRNLAAEGAPQLDAIFLDEGFGTLDADTLEVVADTIEKLGHSGRMVGIITHVRELAERVPVRFEVRKGHRSASVDKVLV